jgi:multidrug efflux pump subunit AcrA (membrane-fusion protein)
VKLGPLIDGKRIVRSGLQEGDKIVVNGLQRVFPGMAVTPKEEMAGNADLKLAKR